MIRFRSRLLRYRKKARKFLIYLYGIYEYNILSNFVDLYPKKMIINLTYWCNSRCVMCNIWKVRPKNEMTYKEWAEVMKDPIFKSIQDLTISGGEATLHKEFNKIAELFVDSMPKLKILTVITNGFQSKQIVDKFEKLAKYLAPKGIHLSASVSLDGTEKMHEKIRKIPRAFEKTTRTIFELKKLEKKYDLSVGSGSLLVSENLDSYEEMKKWYEDNNIPYGFQIVGFHDTFVDNLETKDDVDYKKQQQENLLKFLDESAKSSSWKDVRSYYWRDMYHFYKDKKPRTTPCPFLKDQFVIDSRGDVYYCLSSRPIGNCREDKDVSKIYFSPKNKGYRKWMDRNICGGCNSGCNVSDAIAQDVKHYFWYRLTGKPWYGMKSIFSQFKKD